MSRMNASADHETIGKYELLEEIGHGSMGNVWHAQDTLSGRDVAVKVSKQPDDDSDRSERRRRKLFFNEVRAAGVLQHPNIVATVDAGVDQGRRYIVMEYIRNARTLADFAAKERLLPTSKVLSIMRECAEAFHYAHARGVVHRDIKPTNIMMGEDGRVKIGDFGVAFVDREDVDETQVIGRLGSPRYMSPEQLMGGDVNNQSDIYSLGVVTYELLTGVSPFAGKHVGEIARKVLKEPHVPIRELNPEVPEQLAAVVDRTLKKHPAGRYHSAMELAADLQIIQENLDFTDHNRTDVEAVRALAEMSCFSGLRPEELTELLEMSTWHEHEAGEILAVEGKGDVSVGILITGLVKVQCGETRVARLGPGSLFGDFGLVEAGELGAEIHALERCTVLSIAATQVDSLSPGCTQHVYRLLAAAYAGRLQQLHRRIIRRARQRTQASEENPE